MGVNIIDIKLYVCKKISQGNPPKTVRRRGEEGIKKE
jgi:hypothetical protein